MPLSKRTSRAFFVTAFAAVTLLVVVLLTSTAQPPKHGLDNGDSRSPAALADRGTDTPTPTTREDQPSETDDDTTKTGELPEGAPLHIRAVLIPGETPLPHANVSLILLGSERGRRTRFPRPRTDSEGRAQFTVRESGQYHVAAKSEDGELYGWREITVDARSLSAVHDVLVRKREVRGRNILVGVFDQQGTPFDDDQMNQFFGDPAQVRHPDHRGFSGVREAGVSDQQRRTINHRWVWATSGGYKNYDGHEFALRAKTTGWSGTLELWSHGHLLGSKACSSIDQTISFSIDPNQPGQRVLSEILISVRSGPEGPMIRNATVEILPQGPPFGRYEARLDTGDPAKAARTGNIEPGRYQLRVSDVDHGPRVVNIELAHGESQAIDVELQPAAYVQFVFKIPESLAAADIESLPAVLATGGTPLPFDARRLDSDDGTVRFDAFGLPPGDSLLVFERNVYQLRLSPGENGVREYPVAAGHWVHVKVPFSRNADAEFPSSTLKLLTTSGVLIAESQPTRFHEGWMEHWTWAPPGRWRVTLEGKIHGINKADVHASKDVVVTDREVNEVVLAIDGG